MSAVVAYSMVREGSRRLTAGAAPFTYCIAVPFVCQSEERKIQKVGAREASAFRLCGGQFPIWLNFPTPQPCCAGFVAVKNLAPDFSPRRTDSKLAPLPQGSDGYV